MHDPNVCVICNALKDALPASAPGLSEREAADALEFGEMWEGLLAGVARLLTAHGWRELPHPITDVEHGARFAPPQGV